MIDEKPSVEHRVESYWSEAAEWRRTYVRQHPGAASVEPVDKNNPFILEVMRRYQKSPDQELVRESISVLNAMLDNERVQKNSRRALELGCLIMYEQFCRGDVIWLEGNIAVHARLDGEPYGRMTPGSVSDLLLSYGIPSAIVSSAEAEFNLRNPQEPLCTIDTVCYTEKADRWKAQLRIRSPEQVFSGMEENLSACEKRIARYEADIQILDKFLEDARESSLLMNGKMFSKGEYDKLTKDPRYSLLKQAFSDVKFVYPSLGSFNGCRSWKSIESRRRILKKMIRKQEEQRDQLKERLEQPESSPPVI